MGKLEKIKFQPQGDDPVEFFVIEQTKIGGCHYILVTDVEEGDGEALILKDVSKGGKDGISEENSEEALFAIVTDDEELSAVAGVFEDLLEDVEFER